MWTDRHEEANSQFSKLCERSYNVIELRLVMPDHNGNAKRCAFCVSIMICIIVYEYSYCITYSEMFLTPWVNKFF